jgi:hypothetical protein
MATTPSTKKRPYVWLSSKNIESTRLFTDTCRDWRKQLEPEKSVDNFKMHFSTWWPRKNGSTRQPYYQPVFTGLTSVKTFSISQHQPLSMYLAAAQPTMFTVGAMD